MNANATRGGLVRTVGGVRATLAPTGRTGTSHTGRTGAFNLKSKTTSPTGRTGAFNKSLKLLGLVQLAEHYRR